MDLSFTPEQHTVRDLARQIFEGMCTDARLREVEAGAERYDATLWAQLERSGLLGFGVADQSGGGIVEICLLLEEAGRAAAPAPLWSTAIATLALETYGEPRHRSARPVVGFGEDGVLEMVSGAAHATAILAVTPTGLHLVDPAAATIEPQAEPGKESLARVTYVDAEALPGDAEHVRELARTALCALTTGICDRAVRLTAEYLSGREQFGRPLATFQAVQQRIADAYIDVEVMRWSMWHAAWLLSEDLPAAEAVATAKYWASEGAARALAAAQHLHGGIGVDMDYPLHRYTYLARQAELAMGGAREHLARLGDMLAEAPA